MLKAIAVFTLLLVGCSQETHTIEDAKNSESPDDFILGDSSAQWWLEKGVYEVGITSTTGFNSNGIIFIRVIPKNWEGQYIYLKKTSNPEIEKWVNKETKSE